MFLPSLDQIFSISEKFPCTVFTDTNLIHSNVIEMINSTSVVLMQKRPVEITLMKVELGGRGEVGGTEKQQSKVMVSLWVCGWVVVGGMRGSP